MKIAKLVDWGIDWLTATTPKEEIAREWERRVHSRLLKGERMQVGVKQRQIQGYVGMQGDQCFIGERGDGWMLVVSGAYAREVGQTVLNDGGRASRIDIQLTATTDLNSGDAVRETWEQACAHKYGRGKPPRLRAEITPSAFCQVRIGARSSEEYGRCYDKWLESGEEKYRGATRWELEIKGERAHEVGAALSGDAVGLRHSLDTLVDWWQRHGVRVPGIEWPLHPLEHEKRPPTTLERKMAWVAGAVSPTLSMIADECGIVKALDTAFRTALTSAEIDALLGAAAQRYDS